MRHAARAAAASRRALPAAVEARAMATTAPAVVHPPQQSMRPAYTKDDPSHTSKWMQAPGRSPQEWVASVAPIEVAGNHSNVARCYGGADPSLGHPVEYIVLNDTSAQFPAVCKYCGLRYHAAAHHH